MFLLLANPAEKQWTHLQQYNTITPWAHYKNTFILQQQIATLGPESGKMSALETTKLNLFADSCTLRNGIC